MILFKGPSLLGIELASSMTRFGAKFLSPSVSVGATGLPTELQRYDRNMQKEQTLTGAKGLGHRVATLGLPTV